MITTKRNGRRHLIIDSERGQIGVASKCKNPNGFAVSLDGVYWAVGNFPTRRGGRVAVVVRKLKDVPEFVINTLADLEHHPS